MDRLNYSFFGKFKKEIVGAVIGAVLTGVLSLVAGLYSVTKSFELYQNRDTLSSLRQDIFFLNKLEREFDRNLELLLNQNYTMVIETKKVDSPFKQVKNLFEKGPPTSKEDKEALEFFKAMESNTVGYAATKIQGPSEQFRIETWTHDRTQVTDVDFSLLQDLDEYYRVLRKINRVIRGLRNLGKGSQLSEPAVELISRDVETANSLVKEISKQKILDLKNRVSNEIRRLQNQRTQLLK
jgi:hypothetical protein